VHMHVQHFRRPYTSNSYPLLGDSDNAVTAFTVCIYIHRNSYNTKTTKRPHLHFVRVWAHDTSPHLHFVRVWAHTRRPHLHFVRVWAHTTSPHLHFVRVWAPYTILTPGLNHPPSIFHSVHPLVHSSHDFMYHVRQHLPTTNTASTPQPRTTTYLHRCSYMYYELPPCCTSPTDIIVCRR
jgi:hypothetical protein